MIVITAPIGALILAIGVSQLGLGVLMRGVFACLFFTAAMGLSQGQINIEKSTIGSPTNCLLPLSRNKMKNA